MVAKTISPTKSLFNSVDPALYFVVFSGFYSPILPVFLFFAWFFSGLEFIVWPF